MTGRELSEALRSGRRVYGTCIQSTSPHWPAAIKKTGVDMVFIDNEHTAINRETCAWMCQTFRALGVAPVVRITSPNPYEATVALDNGAEGIIAPYIESAAQVRALTGAVKHRPLKGQYLDRVLAGEAVMGETLEKYVRERNAGNVLIVNVESTPALAALDEICSVPGLDAVQVGPHDLTTSLGVPEHYDHPLYLEAIEKIITTARRHGVGMAVHHWRALEQHAAWSRMGANLIMHSSDLMLFTFQLRKDIAWFRRELGDEARESGGDAVV